MGCTNCSCGSSGTAGCGNKGACSTGSCNKLNTFDWLSKIEMPVEADYDIVEVSFKNGSRKDFYRLGDNLHIVTGDMVTVEASSGGFDIGRVSLMGELVLLQMRKKKVRKGNALPEILRQANERDLERLEEARALEQDTMVRARVIARDLNLDMKIGDVEYQGDRRKTTFYYTADGRVDFRELIRIYAREFKVKIEMRQIGARQESARIGGLGTCGRELCCSTWLSDFKSVSTVAARYQNLAINQSKLSGQCGRLKCCLNYELNTYLEALEDFPKNVDSIYTEEGTAVLIKTDIFKRIMFFAYRNDFGVSEIHQLSVSRVKELLAEIEEGKVPKTLKSDIPKTELEQEEAIGFVDGTGQINLKQLESNKRKKKGSNRRNRSRNPNRRERTKASDSKAKSEQKKEEVNPTDKKTSRPLRTRNRKKTQNTNRESNEGEQVKNVSKVAENREVQREQRKPNPRNSRRNYRRNQRPKNGNSTKKED